MLGFIRVLEEYSGRGLEDERNRSIQYKKWFSENSKTKITWKDDCFIVSVSMHVIYLKM